MKAEGLDILLIDDNPDDRSLAAHHLNKEFDLNITEVKDQDDLEEVLSGGGFDIVITDYLLRWTDGLQVLKEVKSRYPDVNVIMFTGTGNEKVAVEGMKSGLDDYIIKSPEHYELLPNAIRNILEKKRETKRRIQAEKREEFLHSLLRHDVKNKIQIIKGYVELIQEQDLPDESRSHICKVDQAAKESIELIKKVKKLKKVKEEKIEPVKITPILSDVVNERKELASKRDIEINLDLDGSSPKVKGGPLVKELFGNLVENCIKHSDADNIWITGEEKDDELVCSIEDDGKGIPDQYKDKIFEKGFKQGDSAGSGLGMFMAQKIVERYDGSIEVKDRCSEGTCFDVYLEKADR